MGSGQTYPAALGARSSWWRRGGLDALSTQVVEEAAVKITGRTSSIAAAFVGSIIPYIDPEAERIREALQILCIRAKCLLTTLRAANSR